MKVMLVLDNGVQLSAPLSGDAAVSLDIAVSLFNELVNRLNCGETLHRKICNNEKSPSTKFHDVKPAGNTAYTAETKLLAFCCEECGSFRVIKIPKDTGIGDVISCRCGHEIQISGIKTADGNCANCGTRFYNLPVANGLLEIQCRSCKSPVDLAEKTDGSLTGCHNLKH